MSKDNTTVAPETTQATTADGTTNTTVTTTDSTASVITDKKPEQKTEATQKIEEAKPATETKKEETKPAEVKYDLKLPEKSPLDAAHVEKIAAFAKERGFSQEQAQAVLERESAIVAEQAERQKAAVAEKVNSWLPMAKTDKEIGGEAFAQNAEIAKRVVERFGTPEFKQALNETGLGNHPELVRVFVRIGKQMTEDQLVLPGSQVRSEPKGAAEVLYGSST